MNKSINRFLLVFLPLLMVGCAKTQYVATGSDPSSMELSQAAVSIDRSMQSIAEIETQESPMQLHKQKLHPSAYGLGRLTTVDWVGPAEPLVRRIAALNKYQVKVIGNQPAIPVLVSLSERDAYAGDVLRKVSLQTREKMKLLVFPANHLIEIHYIKSI